MSLRCLPPMRRMLALLPIGVLCLSAIMPAVAMAKKPDFVYAGETGGDSGALPPPPLTSEQQSI